MPNDHKETQSNHKEMKNYQKETQTEHKDKKNINNETPNVYKEMQRDQKVTQSDKVSECCSCVGGLCLSPG